MYNQTVYNDTQNDVLTNKFTEIYITESTLVSLA